MIPHHRFEAFERILRNSLQSNCCLEYSNVVFRYVFTKYANSRKITSGAGAYAAGGRWNYPKTFHAVYCSSNPELANREYFAGFEAVGIAAHFAMPLTGVAIQVNLERTLNLTNSATLRKLKVSKTALIRDCWSESIENGQESLCQAIGRAAFSTGCQALLTPAAQGRSAEDYNIVLILENIGTPQNRIKVMRRRKAS